MSGHNKSAALVERKTKAAANKSATHSGKTKTMKSKVKPDHRRTVEKAVKSAVSTNTAPLAMRTDEKTGVVHVARNLAGTRDLLQAALGKNPFRTRMSALAANVVGTVSVATAAAIQANMAVCNEWSTFAALFDEVRCSSTECTVWTVYSTGSSLNNSVAILVFDSDDVTAPANVTALLNYTRQSGPMSLNPATVLIPAAVARQQGFQVTSGPLTMDGVFDESSGTVQPYPVRGSWVSTAASTAIVGSFKFAAEASTGAVLEYRSLIRYHVEFRMRQ